MDEYTPEQRKNMLEVLHSLRFSSLPDVALQFLWDYLGSHSSLSKVSSLLGEAQRLIGYSQMGIDHYEPIEYTIGVVSTPNDNREESEQWPMTNEEILKTKKIKDVFITSKEMVFWFDDDTQLVIEATLRTSESLEITVPRLSISRKGIFN